MQKIENKYINSTIKELQALEKVWESKEYAGTSRFVPAYENTLSDYFKIQHAAAVSNGTDAIEVAVRVLDLQPGSEVMMPAYAPVMSVIPLLHTGLKPIFIDSEPEIFNMSIDDIEKKLTPMTKAVLVVPMWGYPIEMAKLRDFCRKNKLFLIEDASHCHGSKIGNQFVGTLSDISTFSTQERKMVATGEGGFVLTENPTLYKKTLSVRDFGKVQEGDENYPDHVGEYGYYDGSNFRITGFAAAIGEVQVAKLEGKIATRTANAYEILQGIAAESRYKELKNIDNTRNNYYSLVLRLDNLDAKKLGGYLSDHNIISDTYRFKIRPLYEMPQFKQYTVSCPNTEILLHSIVTVPTHEGLTVKHKATIIKCLVDYANLNEAHTTMSSP